jgi:hypothetical protein
MALDALGPYRVLETVATDPATVTVRARRGREPTVLIKTVKPGRTSPDLVARQLEREAELLGSMRHPTLPALVEVLRSSVDRAIDVPALVFVDAGGHRLDAVLARARKLEPTTALAIAIEVAAALAVIHRAGLAHGALHAGLVELTAQGAVVLHEPLGQSMLPGDLSQPRHMSPEQIIGDPPDARSDVFLLGCMLYTMLGGREPFEGDGEGISQRIRHHEPPPLAHLSPAVPTSIARIVSRCLAKRRHDRIADMTTLAAHLTRELRRDSSMPADILVVRGLAAASLAPALPGPSEPRADRGVALPRRARLRLLLGAGVLGGALLVGVGLATLVREGPLDAASGPRGIVEEPAHVRVLARPWAEVFVDGQRIDVTPRAAPIDVKPGRHTLVFRHPSAPEETRLVELSAGQSLLLDVEMAVGRASPVGSASSGSSAAPRP